MKLSYQWLQEYITLTESPEELGKLITMHIAEVEAVQSMADRLKKIVVGEVLEVRAHPNADKLHIGKFDVGETQLRQIVFGGKAVLRAGQKLPIALPGAQVGELVIAERKLRGEISAGMCCLNSELGILNQADEVHLFEKGVKNGTLVSQALGLDDAIIEIDNKTLTHRGDLFNHVGFARELSVVLRRPLHLPKIPSYAELTAQRLKAAPLPFNVRIDDKEICRRYVGAVLSGITVGPSPDWMQRRLAALGVSAINNVVDITNYVMLEFGQPLHAFDYDQLRNHEIHVRFAKKNEQLATLDGKVVRGSDCEKIPVIADEKQPQALAGIMGGKTSEIKTNTTRIALESANFNPIIIRKAAQALAKRTDGSTRHEKNLGLIFPEYGLQRAVQLFQELCGAKLASQVLDVQTVKTAPKPIDLDLDFLNRLIGESVDARSVSRTLTGLDCSIAKKSAKRWRVTPPRARTDLINQQDVVEEIARVRGYDAITPKPLLGSLEPAVNEPSFELGDTIMQKFTQWGAHEVYNYSFYSQRDIELLGLDPAAHLEIQNPMNDDQQYLRQTLLVRLLRAVSLNQRNHFPAAALVEYGHLYFPNNEFTVVGGVVYGDSPNVFYQAKGYVEKLFSDLNVPVVLRAMTPNDERENINYQVFDPAADAIYRTHKYQLATLGIVRQSISEKFSIQGYLAHFTIHVPRLAEMCRQNEPKRYEPISAYPQIDLDISIEVDQNKTWSEIQETLWKAGRVLLKKVDLFDVFAGEKLGAGKKALGIRLWLGAEDRTLEMKEAEQLRTQILLALQKEHDAHHRF